MTDTKHIMATDIARAVYRGKRERLEETLKEQVPIPVAPAPCGSCPYRRGTPPGLWDASEYRKLPGYDEGGMSMSLFLCHQTNATGQQTLCRGWLTVAGDSVAVRLALCRGRVTSEQRDAPVDTPLYATGAEACAAGLAGVETPSRAARTMMARLALKGAGKMGDPFSGPPPASPAPVTCEYCGTVLTAEGWCETCRIPQDWEPPDEGP